jgi:Fic family protein
MVTKGSRVVGRYVETAYGAEVVRAYIPPPLPPKPMLALDGLQQLLEESSRAVGRLDGLTDAFPDLALYIYSWVRKDAVLSSQIEGTQSSISDLLLFENGDTPGVPLHDVQDVSNYVAAMGHGLKRLRGGFPLSLRLLREMHEVLLSRGRGANQNPGEFRRSQNWIGGSRPGNAAYVPPPPEMVEECMGRLELFLHEERRDLPVLAQAALAHVQFESIHPFLDGNGRIGRLLITLLLCARGVMTEPILYLSLYFKRHRAAYYSLLDRVRTHGDWEAWLDFFLVGVRDTANEAADAAKRMMALFAEHRQKIETLGRPAASAMLVYRYMQKTPILSIAHAAPKIGVSAPTAAKALEHLRQLGIVREMTGKQRHRVFVYEPYLAILNEGTEPIR